MGIIKGDKMTAGRFSLMDTFGVSVETTKYFDWTNPTPFMIFVMFLLISGISWLYGLMVKVAKKALSKRP